ncbi:MAG: hypothetical protein HY650_02215 [Acidobacteria bacterium]|nr:hypothetical protein [Acidobacteriota bacterium]
MYYYRYAWGWTVESAYLERAFDPIGQVSYVTAEFYQPGLYGDQMATHIVTSEAYMSRNFMGVMADPTIFRVLNPISSQTKQPRGIAETLMSYGVKNLRKAYIGRHEALERILGFWINIEESGPSLRIFNHCESLITELYHLRRDEKNPKIVDEASPNHLYQCLGYTEARGREMVDNRVEVLPYKLTTDEPNSVAFWARMHAAREAKKRRENMAPRTMREAIRMRRRLTGRDII